MRRKHSDAFHIVQVNYPTTIKQQQNWLLYSLVAHANGQYLMDQVENCLLFIGKNNSS